MLSRRWHLFGVVAGVFSACGVVLSQQERSSLVGGGTFRMGTPASAIAALKVRYNVNFPGVFEDEMPERQVTIADFRMDRTEVTNARFAEFVAAHPEWSPGRVPSLEQNGHYLEHWPDGKPPSDKGEHPVVFVTWPAAQAFCTWAGGRLPTEAEWEYAARAGRDQEFPWGDELPSPERANYGASGFRDTRPVASYPAGAFGLYDLAGNVWEFTADAWTSPGRRVLRGGSYGGGPVNLRTRWRDSHEERNAVAFVGFRCGYSDRL
ncbi:MAG: formylglycine-generating enzyme family protein [Vicinamibacterales bacterium]